MLSTPCVRSSAVSSSLLQQRRCTSATGKAVAAKPTQGARGRAAARSAARVVATHTAGTGKQIPQQEGSTAQNMLQQDGSATEDAKMLLASQGAPIATSSKDGISPAEQAMLTEMIAASSAAQDVYKHFDQTQVDAIFKAGAQAAVRNRISLAKLAVEETRIGCVEDKIIKNTVAGEFIYDQYKDLKTCGVVEEDPEGGFVTVAEPLGVIAGVLPTTHPCAVPIYKCLLAIKTRNGLVLTPHPRAQRSSVAAVRCIVEAAEAAGMPKGLIQVIEHPTQPLTKALMEAPGISTILATGGPALVKLAYSSGHSAIGVGPGNAPGLIDSTADIVTTISSIIQSKTFDNGVVCASEQAIVVVSDVFDAVCAEFRSRGAAILSKEDVKKAGSRIITEGRLNPDIVGQNAERVAELLGVSVPKGTKLIVGEVTEVGHHEPWSGEKLCPVLGMYRAKDFKEALDISAALVEFGGAGHTAAIYVDEKKCPEKVKAYQDRINTGRIIVNTPSAMGGIGHWYNWRLNPSFTLGAGSWGNNSTTANVGPADLLNYKRVCFRREMPENLLPHAPVILAHDGALEQGLRRAAEGRKKALVIVGETDSSRGHKAVMALEKAGLAARDSIRVFSCTSAGHAVTPAEVAAGVAAMLDFHPHLIVAVGGEATMSAAKAMKLVYALHHDQTQLRMSVHDIERELEALALPFLSLHSRIHDAAPARRAKQRPDVGFVTVPTATCTGSEVTPISTVNLAGRQVCILDANMAPDMTILDPQMHQKASAKLEGLRGLVAVANGLESYVSALATEQTQEQGRKALRVLFTHLVHAATTDSKVDIAKVQHATAMTGVAVGAALSGLCTAFDNALITHMGLPAGVGAAVMLPRVIAFNATDTPTKQPYIPHLKYPHAKAQFAELADYLHASGAKHAHASDDEKVKSLIAAVTELRSKLGGPATISEAIGASSASRRQEFLAKVDAMAEQAFDDQSSHSNPRMPLISELRELLVAAW